MWSRKNSARGDSSRRTENSRRGAWRWLRIYRSSSLDPSGTDTMRYLENVVLILGHRFMSTAQHEDIGEMDTRTTQNSAPRWLHLPAPLWLALLLLVIVFFGLIRYRLRAMPLERDEGEYAYSGQLLLQGIPPYKLAYNMKLPGIYAAYAAILATLGETPEGIHLGLLLVNAATTLLLYFLTLALSDRLAAWIAATTFALLSTSSSVLGFAAHATHFV